MGDLGYQYLCFQSDRQGDIKDEQTQRDVTPLEQTDNREMFAVGTIVSPTHAPSLTIGGFVCSMGVAPEADLMDLVSPD